VRTLALVQVAAGLVQGPAINSIVAFGEEWGWRGWLLPRLVTRWGRWPGLVVTGVVWGAWHAPLTLKGYNYPRLGALAAAFFVGFCVLFGVVIGLLRLATGSIWPAVVGHAALNATAGLTLLVGDVGAPPDLVVVGITGLVGWGVLVVVAVGLARLAPAAGAQSPAVAEVAAESPDR